MDKRCGECRFFRVGETRGMTTNGTCRLGKVMGVFSAEMRACPSFSRQGEVVTVASEPRRSTAPRRIAGSGSASTYRVPRAAATAVQAALAGLEPEAIKQALLELTSRAALYTRETIGRGWTDGTLSLDPANRELKSKEIPLDQIFNKLLMIREQLRVLEQKLNACEALHRAERLDLHRRLSLVRRAVLDLAGGWLQPATGSEILAQLWREAQVASLALPFPDLGAKWIGGQATFRREGEVIAEPVEHFFLRVVLLRDHLSAFEAELEARPTIPRDEGATMTGHLLRCHGSLTTFNVLFSDRADYFSSSR